MATAAGVSTLARDFFALVVTQRRAAHLRAIADAYRELDDADRGRERGAAAQARDEGRFDREIHPVKEKKLDKDTGNVIESDDLVTADEGIRESTMESLVAGINARIYTPNEAREYLELNPGPKELDEFQVTANLRAPSEEQPSPKEVQQPPAGGDDGEGDRDAA